MTPNNKPQPGRLDRKNSGVNDPGEKIAIKKQYLGFLKERAEPALPVTLTCPRRLVQFEC